MGDQQKDNISTARRIMLRRGRDLVTGAQKRKQRGDKREVMELLTETESIELREIHLALERIERGIYGQCTDCSGKLGSDALWEIPCRSLCRECEDTPQQQAELSA